MWSPFYFHENSLFALFFSSSHLWQKIYYAWLSKTDLLHFLGCRNISECSISAIFLYFVQLKWYTLIFTSNYTWDTKPTNLIHGSLLGLLPHNFSPWPNYCSSSTSLTDDNSPPPWPGILYSFEPHLAFLVYELLFHLNLPCIWYAEF